MSRIKGKNTKPELLLRKYLFSRGFRYRLHDKKLPGKPDMIFPKYRLALFMNGCFWHGHNNCKYFSLPKSKTDWWREKIDKNINNDLKNLEKLKALRWKVVVIWECELKPDKRESTFKNILKEFKRNEIQVH